MRYVFLLRKAQTVDVNQDKRHPVSIDRQLSIHVPRNPPRGQVLKCLAGNPNSPIFAPLYMGMGLPRGEWRHQAWLGAARRVRPLY